jgi:hypothetical protein
MYGQQIVLRFLAARVMTPPINPQRKPAHWIRKYSAQIGFGSFLLAIVSVVVGLYTLYPPPQKSATVVTIDSPSRPAPTPSAREPRATLKREAKLDSSPDDALQAASRPPVEQTLQQPVLPQRIIGQPKITEAPLASSSTVNFHGLLLVSVVRVWIANGLTAITLKVDGSMNDRRDLYIACGGNDLPLMAGGVAAYQTTIVDDTGHRSNFIRNVSDGVPEKLVCNGGNDSGLYNLEAHEVIYQTLLFERVPQNVRSFDLNYSLIPGVYTPLRIHVTLQ